MNKPKAPKDMTMAELLEQYKHDHNCARCKFDKYCERTEAPIIKSGESIPDCCFGRVWFEERIKEPAPNPFTPDQLAWMRIEQETRGIEYAAAEADGTIVMFLDEPSKSVANGKWFSKRGYSDIRHKTSTFLSQYISWDDDEPLCFSDYAPLEGADK